MRACHTNPVVSSSHNPGLAGDRSERSGFRRLSISPIRSFTSPIVRLPTVIDLADSVFHQSHCFTFAGVDNVDGESQWRVDFLAADRLRVADVAGSAWLDSATYVLRQLTFRLTHPERALKSLKTLEATVTFGELFPSVTVPVYTVATSEARTRSRNPVTGHQEQRLLRVNFLRGAPGSQPP